MLDRAAVESRLEPHLHDDLSAQEYEVKTLKASGLLRATRFDLAFKLLYLELSSYDVPWAEAVYIEHIKALTLGKFIEPGSDEKDSMARYLEAFEATFESIKKKGFDSDQSLIPLSVNGSIANGAHRVASAIYLKQTVAVVGLDTFDHLYDYDFFYKRGVPGTMLDAAATTFVKYAEDVYIAYIWPTAKASMGQITGIIPNIVYVKEVSLGQDGAHNLLSQVYQGEAWLGTIEDGFKGVKGKLVECFRTYDPIRVIAFQASGLNEVMSVKMRLRETFGVGKHSVHITDTKEEALQAARTLFNDNGIHFLEYARPNRYLSVHEQIGAFKAFVGRNGLPLDACLLDSSMVLALYGLREAKDIDYLTCAAIDVEPEVSIERHDSELVYHAHSSAELIMDPRYHFFFDGVKFVAFDQLYVMKGNRAEAKDKRDRKMMEAMIERDRFKERLNSLRQSTFYAKIKARQAIVDTLHRIGLYDRAKRLYHLLKGGR